MRVVNVNLVADWPLQTLQIIIIHRAIWKWQSIMSMCLITIVIIFTIAVKSSFLHISLSVSCSVRTLQTNPNQHVEYHYQIIFLVPRCLFSVYIRNLGYVTDQRFQKHDMSYFFFTESNSAAFHWWRKREQVTKLAKSITTSQQHYNLNNKDKDNCFASDILMAQPRSRLKLPMSCNQVRRAPWVKAVWLPLEPRSLRPNITSCDHRLPQVPPAGASSKNNAPRGMISSSELSRAQKQPRCLNGTFKKWAGPTSVALVCPSQRTEARSCWKNKA
jgi:hypothetical protein